MISLLGLVSGEERSDELECLTAERVDTLLTSSNLVMMSPLLDMVSKALTGVFFIQPLSVVRMTYSSAEKEEIGRTDAMSVSAEMGRTVGKGTPCNERIVCVCVCVCVLITTLVQVV